MTTTPSKPSDLPVRAASAVVMIAVAGTALWLGGWVWTAFVVLIAFGVLWEWVRLTSAFANGPTSNALWVASGIIYIGLATFALAGFGRNDDPLAYFPLVAAVIGTDIGAYAFGRTMGGPKIAPKISPSKTWSGLIGGAVGAFIVMIATLRFGGVDVFRAENLIGLGVVSILIAVLAQAGDFFESWMKRKAGVKDSSNLIPGHGGLFDRVDGQLPVLAIFGILEIYQTLQAQAPMSVTY